MIDRRETSESALLESMFPNHSLFPNRISLWEGWYVCWRSVQICYCLMTRGHKPKQVAIPKAKNSTARSERTTLTMAGPKRTSATALYIRTCCIAVWIHSSCQLWSLLWLCHCLHLERNMMSGGVEFSWNWPRWRNAGRPGRKVILIFCMIHLIYS